jgi:flagellar assembly protein FliH
MSDFTPGFVAGFVARHDAAAAALVSAFALPDFVAGHSWRGAPTNDVAPPPGGPKHFSPADPAARPTAGWDMLDPTPIVVAPPVPEVALIDQLEEAHAAGYAAGLAAAAAAAEQADARDRGLVAGLADSLASSGRFDRERVARQIRETVLTLTKKLVGEVGVSPDYLAARIDNATELLADGAESALLRVHPDDVALLEGRLPKTIFAAGDASLTRGSFVLESASTVVEDGPELWLEQLAQAIDRAPMPATPAEHNAAC